jgi:hypothetical protein
MGEAYDYEEVFVNGKPDIALSGRGILKMLWANWIFKPKQRAADEYIKRYCRYLADRGYGASEDVIFNRAKFMTLKQAVMWIDRTYSEFVIAREGFTPKGFNEYILGVDKNRLQQP